MTRYLVIGAGGMLGQDISHALMGRDVTSLSRAALDVTDPDAVAQAVSGHDVIINAAAYTNVDAAETDEENASQVNAVGAENLAVATARLGSRFVQISTDYVFDGESSVPYAEDSPLGPRTAYGRTKADGESRALAANPGMTLVVRTAWLYGAGGNNFGRTMVKLASERETVNVVADQVGQPTWTADLADQLVRLLDTGASSGIYHGTNSGQANWFEYARELFALEGLDPNRVVRTTSKEYPRPARRPNFSVLGHRGWALAGMEPMRDWRAALEVAHSQGVFSSAGAS